MKESLRIVRHWLWLLIIGAAIGFTVGLFVDPFAPPKTGLTPDGNAHTYGVLAWWKTPALFSFIGLMLASVCAWWLEDQSCTKQSEGS